MQIFWTEGDETVDEQEKPTTPDTFRGRVVCKVSDFIVNNGTHTSIIMT